ncbi:MAG: putative drug exporter of the superfamily, partial [Acidimicrobiia bacterium]|nr:putative drug exporter of the superfamily [Acidimicrobiia bacterium]
LLIVFGGVLAATLPLAVAALAIVGTFVALSVMTAFTDVSILALNLTTALGLGLAIDYCLVLLSRYREELTGHTTVEAALAGTLQTAGRTVLFSAATVAASLAALLVFPIPYLRSFAYAGIAVVGLSALAAVVVLPAVLALLGVRLQSRRRAHRGSGFWGRQADRVMRHAVLYVAGGTALLVLLGLPFLGAHLGRIDDRILPAHLSSRQTDDVIRRDFDFQETTPIAVVLPHTSPTETKALTRYIGAILQLDGVHRVDWALASSMSVSSVKATSYHERFRGNGATWVSIVPSLPYDSAGTKRLVEQLRALPGPNGDRPLVAGATAALTDTLDQVRARVPLALAIVVGATFIVLFLMTGSLVMPVKALLLNALSLTATFGAIVWVFQDGHLSGVLDFTSTGSIDTYTPILMFCVAFGLSMDYEVFLLARIKEEWDLSLDNEHAVRAGLERTGRLVTAAALLMVIAFASIGLTSGVLLAKMFGLGLALAVLVDAFVVRTLLIPAFMKLAGRLNWWAPRPLRRLHLRYGAWETAPITLTTAASDARPSEEVIR